MDQFSELLLRGVTRKQTKRNETTAGTRCSHDAHAPVPQKGSLCRRNHGNGGAEGNRRRISFFENSTVDISYGSIVRGAGRPGFRI
jgi:hypothetical protein